MSKLPQMNALDSLISNFQTKIESLKEQQASLTPPAEQNSSLGFIESGDPTIVYKQIEDTLATGLEILEMSKQYINATPDSESFNSVASIINAVNSLFGEFTSIWHKQLNFNNAVTMEKLKLQNKKELEEYKMQLKLDYFNKTNNAKDASSGTAVPFNTKDFIDAL